MSDQDLYATIVNTTEALIIVLDTEGRIVKFNPACERVSGYRFGQVLGRVFWDFLLTPEEREPVKTAFQDLRAGRFPNTFQNYWVAKSGALRFIEWSNSAITDAGGYVTHVIGTGIDVTDRQQAEARAREAEDRQRELAAAIPLALWVHDPATGRVPYLSPGFETIWGRALPDADTAFEVFRNSIHPGDKEAMFRQLQKEAESGEPGDNEYRIVRPDGTVRWIHSRAFPIRDGGNRAVRIVGYAEDITERKLAEQALRETQQRERALLESTPDFVWFKDVHGRFVATKRKYRDRFEPQAPDPIGKTAFDIFPAAQAAVLEAEDQRVMRSGQLMHFERNLTVRGNERWFDVTKAPIIDEDGKVAGTVGVARDITERKLAEAQRIARDAALRDVLVREVHHRIKNSLQGTVSLIQQLAREHPESTGVLDAAVTRLNAVAGVHGLFGSTGERDLQLDQIVPGLVASLKALYGELPVQLSVRTPVGARVRESEVVPFALILNELVMNAIKHSRSVADGDPVEVELESSTKCARIVIRNRARLFPAHFNFNTGTGLGTGLSLVKSLLPPAGAELCFENTAKPVGTRVELTLYPPVILLSPASASSPAPPARV